MAVVEPGLTGTAELVVKREHLASVVGNLGAEVLSTHQVVLLMERAARNAIENLLPPGKITVGTMINIRHFTATPPGVRVRAEALLKSVYNHKLLFQVIVRDTMEKVAEGQNEQLIVSAHWFLDRVNRKRQKLLGEK
jgi:predicted thioesterase